MTGAFGGTHFYGSASNLTDQGAVRFLHGFQRNSFRANVDQAIGSDVNVAVRTYYSRGAQDRPATEDSGRSFFRLTRVPGIVNILQYDNQGRLYIRPNLQQGGGQNENPLYFLANDLRSDVINRFIGGVTTQYTPAPWLQLEANFSYDLRNTDAGQVRDKGFRSTGPNPDPTTNLGFVMRNSSASEAMNTGLNAIVSHNFGALETRYTLRYSYEQRDSTLVLGSGAFLAFK